MSRETVQDARERREQLASKMRVLASELENDPDTRNWIPSFQDSKIDNPYILVAAAPTDTTLTLGTWLSECADSLEKLSVRRRNILPPFETRRGNSVKTFVIRGVFYWIDFYLARGRNLEIMSAMRPRNIDTADLAGAILREKVTGNDVTQVRKDERRKYTIE